MEEVQKEQRETETGLGSVPETRAPGHLESESSSKSCSNSSSEDNEDDKED